MQLVSLLLLSSSLLSAVNSLSIAAVAPSERPLAKARRNPPKNYVKRDCQPTTYDAPPVNVNLPPFDAEKAEVYRYRQQQSVNMGSWFAHEAWMVPSLFECADGPQQAEIDIVRGQYPKAILEQQWDTFITEDDFKYLASVGINTIRLPIGFWSLGTNFTKNSIFEAYGDVYENSWPRVLRAIQWAGENGIGVLVDMHGAYGSQNGQAHSGVSDGQTNLFTNEDDQRMTVNALVWMTEQLVQVTNVVGIEILNEPQNADNLPDFYDTAATAMRAVPGADNFPLYIHDAFDMNKFASYVSQRTDFMVVDHHSYFVFGDTDTNTPVTDLTSQINSDVKSGITSATQTARGNLVTDEWGCALADGSTDVSDLGSATADYCQSQAKVYLDASPGWAFWSYMLEGCEEGDGNGWCFKGSVGNNLGSTFFSYSSQTSASGGLTVTGGGSSSSSSSSSSNSTSTSTASSSSSTSDGNGDDSNDNSDDNSSSSASTSASSTSTATADDSSSTSTGASCAVSRKRSRSAHSRRRHHQRVMDHTAELSHKGSRYSHHKSKRGSSSSSNSSQGYQDGLALAQKFASLGGSRVGFTLQYIADNNLGNGDDSYTNDFLQGVSDGENQVDTKNRRRAAKNGIQL